MTSKLKAKIIIATGVVLTVWSQAVMHDLVMHMDGGGGPHPFWSLLVFIVFGWVGRVVPYSALTALMTSSLFVGPLLFAGGFVWLFCLVTRATKQLIAFSVVALLGLLWISQRVFLF